MPAAPLAPAAGNLLGMAQHGVQESAAPATEQHLHWAPRVNLPIGHQQRAGGKQRQRMRGIVAIEQACTAWPGRATSGVQGMEAPANPRSGLPPDHLQAGGRMPQARHALRQLTRQ